jgi:hypothetical protein
LCITEIDSENDGMGFLYILQNGLEHAPLDLHKIGHCKDFKGLTNRPKQLRTTGVVGEFAFKAIWEIEPEIDIREVEDAVHLKLRKRREARDREFFQGPLDALISEIWNVLQYMEIEASLTQIEALFTGQHRGESSSQYEQMAVSIDAEPSAIGTEPEEMDDGAQEDYDFFGSMHEQIDAPLERFDAESPYRSWDVFDLQYGMIRDHMAWCRAVYWLSTVLAEEFWHISFGLSGLGLFDVQYIPGPAEAAKLVDFEARLAAQQSAFAELSRVGSGHLFLLNWTPRENSFRRLAPVHPFLWRGNADGHGIGRVQTEYGWEIGLKEGRGYRYFGVSRPLPLELSEKVMDPALKVWTRVIWQLLHCDNGLRNVWNLPMPESAEAPTRMSQVLSLLADSGYRFSDVQANAVAAMWTNRLELRKSGDRLDAEREDRSHEYANEGLGALEVLLDAGLNDNEELSADDLKLVERGKRGYFLDTEFHEFQQVLGRIKPWIQWFNHSDTRKQIKADLAIQKFNRRDEAVLQWLREQIGKKRRSNQF